MNPLDELLRNALELAEHPADRAWLESLLRGEASERKENNVEKEPACVGQK